MLAICLYVSVPTAELGLSASADLWQDFIYRYTYLPMQHGLLRISLRIAQMSS
jgi:hypothetical protein